MNVIIEYIKANLPPTKLIMSNFQLSILEGLAKRFDSLMFDLEENCKNEMKFAYQILFMQGILEYSLFWIFTQTNQTHLANILQAFLDKHFADKNN